ncbi:MAG: response regulator [Desulfuromonadales bacterium]|nr:response regulator [Desulfuromonadales bacterium]
MSKKLLLADDSITIQKVIQITFAHEDYDLTITDNGETAFAKAREIKPDLVIADVYMPGKDGYELTAAIKQDPALQRTPVLLLAGSFEPFDEDKARASRADAWIEKPFESQTLIDKVSELLEAAPVAPAPEAVPAAPQVAEIETPPLPAAEPAMEDPFADISFEEEPVPAEPAPAEPVAAAAPEDDWSDLGQSFDEPVSPESDLAASPVDEAEFSFDVEEPPMEVEEFSFAEPAAVPEDDFAFSGELLPVTEELPQKTVADEPVPAADDFDFGSFDDVDEVMPLGDDDILEAEDLEPAPAEPTLSTWSRETVGGEALFETADHDETPSAELPPLQEEPADILTFEGDLAEPAMEEPQPEPVVAVEQAGAPAEAPIETSAVARPAVATAAVEEKVAALSEAELEAIVERVAGRIIEKLASTMLEQIIWDVVPDLAENLVKEEIRKIREAAA